MKQLFKLKRLDSRGVSHLLLPMVVVMALAVGGTYMLVASRANPVDLSAAAVKKPVANKKTGYLVVYNSDGVTESAKAKVTASGTNSPGKSFACKGVSQANPVIRFNKSGNKVLVCSPTDNTAKYNISYSNAGGSYNAPFAVDVDAGYCTMVYPNPSMTAKVLLAKGNRCPSVPAAIVKKDVGVRVLLDTPKKGAKKLSGFVEISPGGQPVSKNWCSGSLALNVLDANGATVSSNTYAVKYVGSGTPSAKKFHNGVSYCVVKFTSAGSGKLKAGQSYSASAHYSGDAYFNPSDGSSAVVALPAAVVKAKANANGGTTAN
jgi:hypothetical protein